MTKAIAQNISLFSFNDAFKIRGNDRVEAAKGGVFATTTMLTRRDVSCPKKTELDSYRDVAICHLIRGDLKIASAYAKLMIAIEQVKAAREDLQELIKAA